MIAQLPLLGVGPPRDIRPAADRLAPVVWVKRLAILRELRAGVEYVIRDVNLRRGLNIVWAAPTESTNQLFTPGLAGHTAGKTTFCRFIRYVLGERHFANEETTRAIRERLETGWVLAEVALAGMNWTVARPLGIGAHSFARNEGGIEDALATPGGRLEYQAFLDAIAAVTSATLPAQQFPTDGRPVHWLHILQWLARDQECHFAAFSEWRDPSSGSDAPMLTADERHFLLRSVLELVSDEERSVQTRQSALTSQRRTTAGRQPLLDHQWHVDHLRLQTALGIEVPPPSSDLFGNVAREEIDRRRTTLEAGEDGISAPHKRDAARAEYDNAVAGAIHAQRDVDDLTNRVALEEGAVAAFERDAHSQDARQVLAALPPPKDFCQVPLSLARREGCPLIQGQTVDITARIGARSAKEEMARHAQVVAELRTLLVEKQDMLRQADSAKVEASRALTVAQTAYDRQRDDYFTRRGELTQLSKLVEAAEEGWRENERLGETLKSLETQIEASRAEQDALRTAAKVALQQASERYEHVARAILGNDVQASITHHGHDLALRIESNGDRNSAAIRTAKLLAFDLGSIVASIEGVGRFPRLLVHDCPRASDMDAGLYERVFVFAQELEACFEGEPSFQYIITTTTPPPPSLAHEPWVRLRLGGTPTGERLLRIDL